jgi:hypothetical protein
MTEKSYTKDEICRKLDKLIEHFKIHDQKFNEIEKKINEPNEINIQMSSRIDALERRLKTVEDKPNTRIDGVERRISNLEARINNLEPKISTKIENLEKIVSELQNKTQTRSLDGNLEERLNKIEVQQRGLFDKIKKACQKVKAGVQSVVDKAKQVPGIQQAYDFAKKNVPGVAMAVDVAHKCGVRDLEDDFPEYANRSCSPYLKPKFDSQGHSYYRRRDLQGPMDLDALVAETQKIKENCMALNRALGFNPDMQDRGLTEIKNWIKEGIDTCVDKAKEMYYSVKNEICHRDIGGETLAVEKLKIELDPIIQQKINTTLKPYKIKILKFARAVVNAQKRRQSQPSIPGPQTETQTRGIPQRHHRGHPPKRVPPRY